MLKKFLLFGTIILLLLILAFAGVSSYSSSPSFCRSCHNMEPYYQSWRASKHRNIECTVCHFEPGVAGTLKGKFQASALLLKYLTNTYSPKPFANIKDSSCLQSGCHSKDRLNETKPFRKNAIFNHAPHFRAGMQSDLTCTSCHSPLKGGEHISVNESHCNLCHLRDSGTTTKPDSDAECIRCHKNLPKTINLGDRNIEHEVLSERKVNCLECHSHVVKGKGEVPETTCFKCHDFPERAKTREDVIGLHKIHVVAHVECFLCHNDIEHKIDPQAKIAGSDCRSCHLSKHSGVKMLYAGRGGIGLEERPGPMYKAGVDCTGCHEETGIKDDMSFRGTDVKGMKERCVECHNDPRYGDILEQWKTLMMTRLGEVEAKLLHVEKTIGKKPDSSGKAKLLQDGRYNFFLVKQSPGVHNIGYALELLKAAEKNFNILLDIEQPELSDIEMEGAVFWYRDTEGLAPVRFDHSLHQGLFPECVECHDAVFSMEKGSSDSLGLFTMSNMERGKFCGACHNGETAESIKDRCEKCHISVTKDS